MALRLMVMAGWFNLGAADFLHSWCLHLVTNILGCDLVLGYTSFKMINTPGTWIGSGVRALV